MRDGLPQTHVHVIRAGQYILIIHRPLYRKDPFIIQLLLKSFSMVHVSAFALVYPEHADGPIEAAGTEFFTRRCKV